MTMKAVSSLYLITSMFVMPCVLNLENLWCCLFVVVNIVASFLLFKKRNPEYIIK